MQRDDTTTETEDTMSTPTSLTPVRVFECWEAWTRSAPTHPAGEDVIFEGPIGDFVGGDEDAEIVEEVANAASRFLAGERPVTFNVGIGGGFATYRFEEIPA